MPSGKGAGTNPIHNKKAKAGPKEELTEEEIAFQNKQKADKKAQAEAAKQAQGKKGPLSMGGQGIKKSGKK